MVDKVVWCLCIIMLLSNASYSLIAPFYPNEVIKRGIDPVYTGFLMGIQALTFIFSAFLSGQFLHLIGRPRGMIVGALLIIISFIGFGALGYIDDQFTFIFLSFVWKFTCGVGAGINSTASFAIISIHYKEDREKTIGMGWN